MEWSGFTYFQIDEKVILNQYSVVFSEYLFYLVKKHFESDVLFLFLIKDAKD